MDLMQQHRIQNDSELARYIKVAHADLKRFLASKTKNPDKIILSKLAAYFEISIDELIQDNRVESIYIAEDNRHHETPGAVLRYLMQEIGNISEGELFRRTGVPQPTIHRILSGATPNPRMDSIEPLAEFFNITSDQMLGRIPLPVDRIPGTFMALRETKKALPLLSWLEVVNWPGLMKNPDFKTNRQWVSSDSGIKGDGFALEMMNTDYLPEFRQGTIIIVDSKRTPKQGDFALGVLKKNNLVVLGQMVIENNSSLLLPLSGSARVLFIDQDVLLRGVIAEAKHQF
jgi:transcriptional regulator with XRE-family HTH domain